MLTATIFIPILAAVAFALVRRSASRGAAAAALTVDGAAYAVPEGKPDADHARAETVSGDRAHERRLQAIATAIAAAPLLLLIATWMRFEGTGAFELVEAAEW